ncbi:MAG: type IX secretion system outer membrane channel protein PorV [Crocinitomicaceae bacterium]|nr:type IX secretion system outer membrane channel protein PorV [Flavobacteriales bacterium]NQZ37597.1 type IX secretion system outer membrane channel protein PorV [Crocinitomicaceae bacterium]
MMNKIRNTVIFSFVAISAMGQVTDDALQLNTITTAVPFMSITPDSRAGAMGEAGTALSASSTSLYWNTSMLTFAEDKSAISISYVPWLRQLTNDIHLSYLSGYYKINDRHAIGGALRYFNLGEITFTDESANIIREDKPSEFELTAGYAFRLSDKMSVGINGKFAYSNLTGGLPVAGVETKPGVAGATDISFTYSSDEAKIGSTKGTYNFAATINNVGNKIAYSSASSGFRDFLPMNLKIGNAFVADFDAYNKVTFSFDVQKLLVPTPPTYEIIDGERVRIAGLENNVGVISGLLQSFYDAPGIILTDEVSGDYLQNEDGSYQIKKGSRFLEELTEINLAAGMEWWYNDVFALRGGFFFEHNNKGARQYFNLGAGFKYNKFGIDISYLAALKRNNPLANTLRFTLRMVLGGTESSGSTAPN